MTKDEFNLHIVQLGMLVEDFDPENPSDVSALARGIRDNLIPLLSIIRHELYRNKDRQ